MTLVLLDEDAPATLVARVPEGEATREHPLRDLIFAHPGLLPLHEFDPVSVWWWRWPRSWRCRVPGSSTCCW